MTRVLFAAAGLLTCGLLPNCTSAGTIDEYRYVAPIERDGDDGEEIVAVPLTTAVYSAMHDRGADVRIVDAAGREVPYQLIKATESKTSTVRERSPSGAVTLNERDDGSLEIIAPLADKSPSATLLVIRTPLKNFARHVQVYGSLDGKAWHDLNDDAVLFDYSRYMDVHNFEIALPENNDRQYRIVIEAVTDERQSPMKELTRQFRSETETERTERTTLETRPLRIDGIDFYHMVSRPESKKDVRIVYPVADYNVIENEKQKETIVHVPMRREPLTELTIETTTPNFMRHAVVQVPARPVREGGWRDVASMAISSIRFRTFERRALTIAFPEQWSDEYRIVIRNEDNPPLEITGVTAMGNEYRALFIAAPAGKYRMAYGNEAAKPPHYDTAPVIGALDSHFASQTGTLGAATENLDIRPAWSPLDNRLFFGAAIGVVVAVLAAVVYRAVRNIDQLPADDR